MGDVLLDVGLLAFGVGGLMLAPNKGRQLTTTLLQGQFDFLDDLGVMGHRFFAFRGKGDPYRGHVHHDDQGRRGQGAGGLLQAIVPPGGRENRLVNGAGRLLIEQGHAVGIAEDTGQRVAG